MFTVAGISTLNGQVKIRFANDFVSRIKNLQRNGHTDVTLVELPQAMEKTDAAAYLSTLPEFSGIDAQVAINEFLGKKTVSKKLSTPAVAEVADEVADEAVEATAEDKLAAKRARDAARKREKRALMKAAYEAEILRFPATEAEAV